MTTLPRLLNSSLLLGLFLTGGALAADQFCPKTFNVLEREKGDNYTMVPKQLERLYCNNTFEGADFKIVESTSEEAIPFDHKDPELLKRAANVYHHLSVAKNFWLSEIKSDYVRKLPQITVRLNITNAFSNTRHYKNEELEKNYNNAWSIPDGESPSFAKEKLKWGKEIWFSPMKKIEQRKEVKSKGDNPIHQSLILVKDPVIDNQKSALIYQALSLVASPEINQSLVLESALKRLGAIAIMVALIETSKYMDKWFMEKYYYVDTAMIPEIIYHEFAHIAMSDTMKTVHSVPVIEGMADYFAARIATRRKMYDRIEGFSNNNHRDTESRMLYHPYLEGSWNSTSDFTLSLLWKGKTEFEKANAQRAKKNQPPLANYDEIVHNAHFEMNEDSDIQHGLTGALIKACNKSCNGKRAGVNTLNAVFESKGMN